MKLTQKTINDLAYKIIGRAIEVHNELGPGLLESVYEKCLCYELKQNNIAFKNQVEIAIKSSTKASSLAFNFFLALFPAVLFLFSLIPFIPLEDFLDTTLHQIQTVLPKSIKPSVMETLQDLISNERQGFLIINIKPID